jgi:hypothetical protein
MERNEGLSKFLLRSLVFAVAAMLTGCGGPADKQAERKPAATSTMGQQGDKDHSGPAAGKEEEAPGLAELSVEDRTAAEKQKVCPVTGERLGGMGKPVKITVKGKTVFLCCAGCEDAVRKDPDKYLAKLKASGEK